MEGRWREAEEKRREVNRGRLKVEGRKLKLNAGQMARVRHEMALCKYCCRHYLQWPA